MNPLHRYQMSTMISYIQSPNPATYSKIWKSWLSLWSLVNQTDAQGQWLHTLRPGSTGDSLSESFWPIYLYRGPYRLSIKAFPFIFSFQWDRNTLGIASSLCNPPCVLHTPQSLPIIREVSHSTSLGEEGSIVRFPWPNIGKKQNTLEVWIRKHICIYFWRQNLTSDHISTDA